MALWLHKWKWLALGALAFAAMLSVATVDTSILPDVMVDRCREPPHQ
jgi:hypothetical protein